MIVDGAIFGVMSACAAALLVVWLSIVLGLFREARRHAASSRAAWFALLVLPAPVLAWRAGLRKRAIAMVALAVVYVILRVIFR